MSKITYRVVEHDGGWAYNRDSVFSEPFRTREAALAAARRVAAEQRRPGETTLIDFEDEHGRWHQEMSDGQDRPETEVEA